MVNNKFDIVGIGNAIVDILYYSDDEFLNEQNFVKGSMTIIRKLFLKKIFLSKELKII